MKTYSHFTKHFFAFLFFAYTNFVNAQLLYSPAIEWTNVSWSDEDIYDNYQTQDNSGEDWWYSHKNAYNSAGQQVGYVSVGYTSLILRSEADFIKAQQVINEGPLSTYNPINHDLISTGSGTYINFDFSSPVNLQEGCGDRDYAGEHRIGTRGNVALNDLNGNMLWCKALTIGEMGEVIQDGDFFYVVGTHDAARPYGIKTSFLPYNPTLVQPSNNFSLANVTYSGKIRHLYVAKLDFNGNIIWEAIYGMPNYSLSAYESAKSVSYGYDLIKSSNGNIIATGYAQASTSDPFLPFVIEINPLNGYVLKQEQMPLISNTNSYGFPNTGGEAHSIVEIANTGEYAIACVYAFHNLPTSIQYDDYSRALVWLIDNNLQPSATWSNNPIQFIGNSPTFNSNIWEVKYHQVKQELLVPVINNSIWCASAGNMDGFGQIYRYKNDGSLSTSGSTNPSLMGALNNFDLRIGVEETFDGGFIAVSSGKSSSSTIPTDGELGIYAPSVCPDFYSYNNGALGYPTFDTDPIIIKYNSNGETEWRKAFDIIDGRAREHFPGDIKRQECLYKVSQAQDGGYVFSGNCSYNFDDNYMFKLYNDCNSKQNYTIKNPSDNIISISTNTVWNSSQKVIGSVHVESGVILTITGNTTVIEFADTKLTGVLTNIDVEKGGRLVVQNGATLTSILSCPNSMWDGIIIEGTVASQSATNQGWVVVSSSNISNARKGIFVGGRVKNSGGVARVSNSTFKNNFIDVEIMPYSAPLNSLGNEPNNLCFFSSNNFIGDAFLNDPSYVDILTGIRYTTNTHIILRSVKGIQFEGNNFKTELLGVLGTSYQTHLRSIGISSINASFSVHRSCNIIGPDGCSGAKNNFDNLSYGIYAQSTNSLKTFTVDQTNFTNCNFSLYQAGINYSTITKNEFLINTTIPAPVLPLCVGGPCLSVFDYTNQCSGFNHSENKFAVTGTSQQVIGSVFNATGANNNESFHNEYTGLARGTQTQLINGVNATSTGLQIRCNRNYGAIASDILSTSGILPQQGVCITDQSTANNVLSHNGLPEGDIKVASIANNFVYTYAPTPSSIGNDFQIPLQVTSIKVNPTPCTGLNFNYTSSCPLPATGCSFPCWSAIAVNNNNSAKNVAQILLDGDAISLYNAINSGMSAGNLKNLLISKSPYLSDGVLIAYLRRPNTPTSGHIKDVIIANSPVTANVKEVFDNLSLPNGIRNQINAAQIGISARTKQEELVQYYELQRDLAINSAIRLLLNDTLTTNTDSIIAGLLKFNKTVQSKTDLTNLYISKGGYLSAQILIDSLATIPCMSKHWKMLQHNKNIHQNNKDWFEINNDPQLMADISSLAIDSLSYGFSNAKCVFAMVKGKANYEVVENPSLFHNMEIIYPDEDSENDTELNTALVQIKAYPNPFKDEICVSLLLPININSAKLQLVEIASGKIIQEQDVNPKQNLFKFNTTQLSNGVYIIVVKGENISSSYVKVIHLK
jgi:hypothetical protein